MDFYCTLEYSMPHTENTMGMIVPRVTAGALDLKGGVGPYN